MEKKMNKVEQQIELWEQTPTTSYVELPRGVYIIDGERIVLEGYNNKYIVETPTLIQKESLVTTTTHYESNDDQDTLSKEEYSKQLTALESKGYFDEEDYVYMFNNLDDEYAYKKFINKWKPVIVQEVVLIDQKIIIHEDLGQPNPYVLPMKKLNGNLKDTMYQYRRKQHIFNCVKESLAKYNKVLGCEDQLQYSKFDGQYTTIAIKDLKNYETGFEVCVDSLEKVLSRYNEVDEDIKNIIDIYFQAKVELESVVTVKEVLDSLFTIHDNVRSLNVKVKNETHKQTTLTKINDLKTKLEKAVLSKKEV